MKSVQRIFLIGPMGAGKTTIGRQLAKVLSLDFADSDHEIEARTGANIPLIFDLEGEEGFRDREQAMIDELSQRENMVLATGGGAVLREENRQHLQQRGKVIYLHTNIEQLLARTKNDQNRPLLQTENPRQKFEDLMAIREPLYRETAHVVINTNQQSITKTVQEIVEKLKEI
ncbi:MAG: shikimate kinase AroK [Gammaproteobacteria bacterium]|nr:shikimate kinase AroK [Gammaproteobacteria bacterium]